MNRRVIKFRAWDEEVREMLFPSDCLLRLDFKGDLYLSNKNAASSNIILMQFTGLKDKNGKEIYEGDIVRQFGENLSVFFNKSTACFDVQHTGGDSDSLCMVNGWDATDIEVIGNIYENANLITA